MYIYARVCVCVYCIALTNIKIKRNETIGKVLIKNVDDSDKEYRSLSQIYY